LAMLVEMPKLPILDVIMAVEDDRCLQDAIRLAAAIRRAGLSAEMIASGSPRKRYDKATKILAKTLVSINFDGEKSAARSVAATASKELQMVTDIAQALFSPK
jgi:histidyl-tRNA synthetase